MTLPRHNGARDPSLKLPAIQIADSIQRGNGEYTFEKRRFCPRFLSPTRVSRRVCAPLPFLPSPRLSTSPIVRDFRTPPRDKFSHLPYSSPPCENQTNSFSFSPLFCFKFDLAVNDITISINGDGRDYMFLRVQSSSFSYSQGILLSSTSSSRGFSFFPSRSVFPFCSSLPPPHPLTRDDFVCRV